MKRNYIILIILILGSYSGLFAQSTSVTYNYTGSSQSWTVPPCVTSITVTIAGAGGGGMNGGNGAVITGTMNVTSGETLQIEVGGQGSCPSAGYNGGGSGGSANNTANNGCGGGGASDIRTTPFQLNDRIIVASGGGGMGGGSTDADGGEGGCNSGGLGVSPYGVGGGGGSQTTGGSGGPPWISSGNYGNNGSLGTGGSGAVDPCYNVGPGGGGGGGYYGGGGGGSDCYPSTPLGGGGGGGGSSLTPAGFSCTPNSNNGNGYLIITYSPVATQDTTLYISTCDPYHWDNNTYPLVLYTQSGVYIDTIMNSFGCDSIVTLDLTIDNESDSIIYITASDSLVWNGFTYTQSGVYTDTILNNSGCETFIHLYLTINNPDIVSSEDTVCFGGSVTLDCVLDTFFGQYDTIPFDQFQMPATTQFNYSTPVTTQGVLYAINVSGVFNISDVKYYDGAYLFADTNSNVVIPEFIVRWNFNGSIQLQNPLIPIPSTYNIDHEYWYYFIGDGNPMSFEFLDWPYTDNLGSLNFSIFELLENSNSTYLWSTGDTTASITVTPSATTTYSIIQTINGVSSTDSMTIFVNIPTSNTTSATACETYTWLVNNQIYTGSGLYVDTSMNANGCLHIDSLMLIINSSTSNSTSIAACDTYTWSVNNQVYTISGLYVDSSMNGNGCLHIDSLNLTIDNATSNSTTITACDTYTWSVNSQTYTTSGIYTDFSVNTAGCLHSDTLMLTINNSTSNSTTITACDTYTWGVNNQTYTVGGTYTDISTNSTGCTHTEILYLAIGYTDDIDLLFEVNNISCFGYNDGSIILNPDGGTSPYQFAWQNGSTSPALVSLPAGIYPFTVTDYNGCTVDSFAIIQEANQIFLDFIATSPICRYDESTLSINISNSISNTYTISLQDSILRSFVIDTNGFLIPEGIPITLTPNFSGQVVIVSMTDDEGCVGTFNDHVHIEVKQLPVLNLNEDDLCVGDSSYTLSNATPLGGTYFINDVMTDYFDVENLQIGQYNIRYEYTDLITSCYSEINEVITINASPEADFVFNPQPTDLKNADIFFRDNSDDLMNSVWDLGDGTIIYDDLNFWHTYTDTGTYPIKYYVTNQFNCTDSLFKHVVINPIYKIFIPAVFSPNDDGDNDYFYPSIIGGSSYNMKIYDRWGGLVYDKDNGKWDGTLNTNNYIMSGVYSYSITVLDFKEKPFIYTGIVTLFK